MGIIKDLGGEQAAGVERVKSEEAAPEVLCVHEAVNRGLEGGRDEESALKLARL